MIPRLLLAGLASLLIAIPALAATTAERSPFAQGHWWNPARSGNGFEIFNAAGQVAVVWYTFEQNGKAVWYTAQGDESSLGSSAWPLMRHKWQGDRISQSTQVGTLRLDVRNAEKMTATWQLGGQSGAWDIEPLVFSGVVNEVDHSGSWFAPANGGWGVTVSEQGEVLGGAVFTYDTAGEPTWVAGFQRGGRTVQYFACTGSCPSCPYQATQNVNAGYLTFDFASETRLTLRNNLLLPIASGVAMDRAEMVPLSRPASWRAADRQLASFTDEASLRAYLSSGMFNVTVNSGADFSPAPPGTSYSQTNLQESGVDEADTVKSDGRYIYTYAYDSSPRRVQQVRIAEVVNEGASLQIVGNVALAANGNSYSNAGLYLDGTNLVSLSGTVAIAYSASPPPWLNSGAWRNGTTLVEVLSTANPAAPAPRWRAEIDGHPISSRRIGNRLYVVSRFVPNPPGFIFGGTSGAALATNQQVLAAAPIAAFLPKVRVNGGDAVPLLTPQQVFIPPQGSRLPTADFIIVTAIDLAEARIAQSIAIAGTVDTVYVSSTNLYLARSRYELRSPSGALISPDPYFPVTDVHQVALGAAAMGVAGSGSIEGFFGGDVDKSAFRMSEHQGRLRTVSSSSAMWGANSNRVTILEPSTIAPGLLKTVAYLPNAQRPEPLGKPGEFLYGTRFLGERLYAVTFRQTDPLYVVDLATAADPKIAGSLEVPGFSDYLHPVSSGLVLGFGRDTSVNGTFQGLQLSLYDVSDAGKPRELQRMVVGSRGTDSAMFHTHHAFSTLARQDGSMAVAFPARVMGEGNAFKYSGLMRFELRDNRLAELPALVTHSPSISSGFDAASYNARSVQFRNGTVYIGYGQMWHQDSAGVTRGPL
jgi:uncharacterized secreted protein with C-terminal beta-propeller domain